MAANMKAVKLRMKSIQSTMQITGPVRSRRHATGCYPAAA